MKGLRAHLFAFILYMLWALGPTWPLAAHIATHIPGSAVWAFDESTFVWNMWWFKFSLLDLKQSPLHTDFIFYPLGIDLVLYTFNFFNALLGLPLQLFLTLPLASNLVLLFAYGASGYGRSRRGLPPVRETLLTRVCAVCACPGTLSIGYSHGSFIGSFRRRSSYV